MSHCERLLDTQEVQMRDLKKKKEGKKRPFKGQKDISIYFFTLICQKMPNETAKVKGQPIPTCMGVPMA